MVKRSHLNKNLKRKKFFPDISLHRSWTLVPSTHLSQPVITVFLKSNEPHSLDNHISMFDGF